MEHTTSTVILTEIGRALLVIQQFESYLKRCLTIVGIAYSDGVDLDRKTLGRLIVELRKKVDLPADFAAAFSDLLSARNTFVHSLILQEWFGLNTPEAATATARFIERMYNLTRNCNAVLVAYMLVEAREHGSAPIVAPEDDLTGFVKKLDDEFIPYLKPHRPRKPPSA